MTANRLVRDVMAPEVRTIEESRKLSDVRKLLVKHSFHHVPIVSDNKLVGIISANDMVRLTCDTYGTDERSMDNVLDRHFSIDQVMNRNVITIKGDATIREAAMLLGNGTFHSLPVIDADGAVVGIITSTDLIRLLTEED